MKKSISFLSWFFYYLVQSSLRCLVVHFIYFKVYFVLTIRKKLRTGFFAPNVLCSVLFFQRNYQSHFQSVKCCLLSSIQYSYFLENKRHWKYSKANIFINKYKHHLVLCGKVELILLTCTQKFRNFYYQMEHYMKVCFQYTNNIKFVNHHASLSKLLCGGYILFMFK